MDKALLNFHDIQPDAIVDELTHYDNVMKDRTAVGYIDGEIAVAISWYGNKMQIRNIFNNHKEKFESKLRRYFTEALGGIFLVKIDFMDDRCIVQFFFHEEA